MYWPHMTLPKFGSFMPPTFYDIIWPFWPWYPCKASLPRQTHSIFRSSRQPVDPRRRHPEAWKIMKYAIWIYACMVEI